MVTTTVLLDDDVVACEFEKWVIPPPPQANNAISNSSMSPNMTAVPRRFRPMLHTSPNGTSVANQKARRPPLRRGELGSSAQATLVEALMVKLVVAPAAPGVTEGGEKLQVMPDGWFGQESVTEVP